MQAPASPSADPHANVPWLDPWAKRSLAGAALIAVVHSAAWAGYVTHLQAIDFAHLEPGRALIEWLDWTRTVPDWNPPAHLSRPALYLKLQPLAAPGAATQLYGQSKMYDYFTRHRAGDVVDVWIDRRTGRIEEIAPPEAPSFWRLLRVLLATVGLVTFFIATVIFLLNQPAPPLPEH